MEPTKENIEFCNRQLRRLKGVPFFDAVSAEFVQDLHEALLTSRDQAQAEAVMSGWKMDHKEFPGSTDIYQMIREMNRNQSGSVTLPPPCAACAEIPGYKRVIVTVKAGVFQGEEREGLMCCNCARGKALAEAALREKKERPSSPDFAHIGDLL